jgi:hypothetical protein
VVVRLVLSHVVNCRQVAPPTFVADPSGPATKVHAKPYVLEPEIILTFDLVPTPGSAGTIEAVERSEWAGMRHREIGNFQAWHYPADRVLVHCECFLNDGVRSVEPTGDPVLTTLPPSESAIR